MIINRIFAGVAALALALGGSASAGVVYHTSAKLQIAGINMNAGSGVTAGYGGVTFDRAPIVDGNGKAITLNTGCSQDVPTAFSNLNAKANATATSIAQPATAAAAAAAAVQSPVIAGAFGDTSAQGGAGLIAAAALTGKPADVIAAYCGRTSLPSAAPGSIVRDGVSPSPGAPAAATPAQ